MIHSEICRVLIAAGGTGGHIYPGIAVGKAIEAKYGNEAEVWYACGERELERKLYSDNFISPVVFPARQIRSGIIGKLASWSCAFGNLVRAARFIRREQIDVVLGMGGYVSGPTTLAAKLCGCRVAIHEANSIPGRTNRWLAPYMDLVAVHFASTLKQIKTSRGEVVGMPLRPMKWEGTRQEACEKLGLDAELTTVLITGGSQGARFLYEKICDALPSLDASFKHPVQILWSTGEANLSFVTDRVSKLQLQKIKIKLVPFITEMGAALACTDFAIARSGAGTLAEFVSHGIFAVYVPFPKAIYDHQTLNAREAEAAGLGFVLKESDITPEKLTEALTVASQYAAKESTESVQQALPKSSAEILAEELLSICGR
jgi:UDP-N-acetylglucosamine--N-acetylmuramyl-(pentapeptide) pyrophosphoryl-undecaprenol N-acetylglucosamine transferase